MLGCQVQEVEVATAPGPYHGMWYSHTSSADWEA